MGLPPATTPAPAPAPPAATVAAAAGTPVAPAAQPPSKSWLRHIVTAVVIYAIAFSVPFVLENSSEIGELFPEFARKLMDSGAWYQIMTSAGPRHVLPRFVALVSLDTKSLPASLLVNVCDQQRELLANLIDRAGRAHPSILVLDFVFLRDSCGPSQTGANSPTAHLVKALAEVAKETPVIAGQEAASEQGVLNLKDSIPELKSIPNVRFGLVIFNRDLRKVPLSWDVEPGDSMGTLAYETAHLYRSSVPDHGAALKSLEESGRHPFTAFMPENAFVEADGRKLLCGQHGFDINDWKGCLSAPADAGELDKLRGRIAVVGWHSNDLHHTIIGEMPGFVIHANYIEALLDEHYLKTIGFWWQLGMSALWFLCMDIPFWICKHETAKPFAIAVLIWVVIALLVYYVAVVNLGFYSALFVPSLAALVIRSVYRWHESE